MGRSFLKWTRLIYALYVFSSLLLLLACDAQQFLSFGAANSSGATSSRYLVKANDTLAKIAQNYGVTVEQLIALNMDNYPELSRDASLLKPGMELIVPNLSVSLATRAAETRAAPTPGADLDAAAKLIIEKINVARAGKKIFLLREDKQLTQIAHDRSVDMIQRNFFSHVDPLNGQEPFLRYLQATHYAYQYAGENIAEVKNDVGWVP
jgi:murein DD-endopeptidase MepM/ murein hydrolase activator NlpD